MPYKRLDLKNNTTLDETHLKHFEDGIEANSKGLEEKADSSGYTPHKYLGTDANGKITEMEAPEAGGLAFVEATGDGTAYKATVTGYELEQGLTLVLIPDKTNTNSNPTLNLNNTGAVEIRARVTDSTSSTVALRAGQIAAGKPVVCLYDGMYWIAQGLEDADVTDFPEITNLEIEQIIKNIGGL